MATLFLIPARGGSKGVPGKNIKLLNGKPLICYSIDMARKFVPDDLICVSTDDEAIVKTVENYGLNVPFVRPAELATDTSGSYEVILHAIDFYKKKNIDIDRLVLFQPTSPFRQVEHVKEALAKYEESLDAVISVKLTHSNPYQLMYALNKDGFIEKLMGPSHYERRQDLPEVYELNGAIYILNVNSILKNKISEFKRIRHYEMPELNSVDIDTPLDWAWAEFLIEKKIISLNYE